MCLNSGNTVTVPKRIFHFLDGAGHRHSAQVSLHNSKGELDLTTFSTVLNLLLSTESLTLLGVSGGRLLVNKGELARDYTLTVANQVININKGSTDVHELTLLLMEDVKLEPVSDRQVDFNLVSSRLPGGVATVVDYCGLSQELLLASRLDQLHTGVGWLLVVAGVLDSHSTLDIYHQIYELSALAIVKALFCHFSLGLLSRENFSSFSNLE